MISNQLMQFELKKNRAVAIIEWLMSVKRKKKSLFEFF